MAQKNTLYLQEHKAFENTEEFSRLLERFQTSLENNTRFSNLDDRYFLQKEFTEYYVKTLNTTIENLGLNNIWNATSLIYMFPKIFSIHYNETIKPLLKDAPILVEKIEWRFILATLWELLPQKYYLFEIPLNEDIKTLLEDALEKNEQLWFHFITLIVNAFDSEKNYFVSIYDDRLPEDFFSIKKLQKFISEKIEENTAILEELCTIVDQIIDQVRNKNFK